jgi:small-conductance mechanosensitive channel
LFSATDTVLVEGRPVVLDYGVTVGKSIGVLLLFGLGAWLAARLSRRLIDMLVRRGAIGAPLGRVLYRWLMTLLLLAVSWGVLKMARIPLTAFAFIGGALAIGVGFAAQNLLKNLMSGAIVLFERKIRVGDIVTIGAVSGTVVAVDLRSTTLRGFDGIDTILPNSHLLENAVADWSHGAGRVRSELLVPVAYGSDCAAVAQQLLDCAQAHGKVLAEPEPEVLLTDFAAGGPVFKLWIWTSLQGGRAAPLVASDLRLAIDRDLRAMGIAPPRTGHDVALTGPGPAGPAAS